MLFLLLLSLFAFSNTTPQNQRETTMMMMKNMKEECGEELLTLGLSINSGWSPDVSKKRKRPKDHEPPPTYQLFVRNGDAAAAAAPHHDDTLHALLRTRDQMLRQLDPTKRRAAAAAVEDDGKAAGLELIRSLLVAATAVDGNNISSAVDSLTELYRSVSPTGDPVQRVTAYFADGLAARLLKRSTSSPSYSSILLARPTAEEEFSAFTQLYQASPYYQFAHFTANQAIVEAFDKEVEEDINGRRSLHVIDLDVSYGFQWPSLIQSLSDKATSTARPISLRLTGLGESLDRLKETGERLTNFADGCCNLHFQFEGLLRTSSGSNPRSCSNNFKIDKSETLVVNSAFYLQSLRSSTEVAATLKDIYSLNPSVVVLVEKEGCSTGTGPRSFLSRFMESLRYFAAMFDSLDDCLPADSVERISIESNHLGREIKNAVATCGGERESKLESLKERMEKNHFRGVKLSSRSLSQAKLLLKIKSHCSETEHGSGGGGGGFRVFWRDDGGGLSLVWQDRRLITASAWRCAPLA